MTYKQLLEQLMLLDDEKINQLVTIHDISNDEYIPVSITATSLEPDTLEENRFCLIIGEESE